MKPPTSKGGTAFAAIGILAAAAAAGAALGYRISPLPPSNKRLGAYEGGTLAALATSFGGLVVGATSPRWRRIGEMTGLIGVGTIAVLATIGAAQGSALTSAPQLPASTPPASTPMSTPTAQGTTP